MNVANDVESINGNQPMTWSIIMNREDSVEQRVNNMLTPSNAGPIANKSINTTADPEPSIALCLPAVCSSRPVDLRNKCQFRPYKCGFNNWYWPAGSSFWDTTWSTLWLHVVLCALLTHLVSALRSANVNVIARCSGSWWQHLYRELTWTLVEDSATLHPVTALCVGLRLVQCRECFHSEHFLSVPRSKHTPSLL
jgi:hypothetical protein